MEKEYFFVSHGLARDIGHRMDYTSVLLLIPVFCIFACEHGDSRARKPRETRRYNTHTSTQIYFLNGSRAVASMQLIFLLCQMHAKHTYTERRAHTIS